MKTTNIFITFLLLMMIHPKGYASDECKLNLLWGHGGAGNVRDQIKN